MDLDSRFHHVAVIGAAGKMGSGIALLLAREMAFRALENPRGSYTLNLIDTNAAALAGLLSYLQEHGAREAEKQLPRLRSLCPGEEAIPRFVDEMLRHVRTGISLSLASESLLVLEAAFENEALKTDLFGILAQTCPRNAFFFSNTSSIPLHVLSEASGLQGRLVGFHFYNPSAVQKLIELIMPADGTGELGQCAQELAKTLGKVVVPSQDIAGFIGNGYLMRTGLHALAELDRLTPEFGFRKAMLMVDEVSRDWLLRPMGIFQLMDYVGLDVFQLILKVMAHHLEEDLQSDFIDRFVALGIKGGETFSATQKNGIFQYEKNRPIALFDPEIHEYVPLDQFWGKEALAVLGARPDPSLTWKSLKGDPDRESRLREYFLKLNQLRSRGADLATRLLEADRVITYKLVEQGVAASVEDVNRVLQMGFMHLYGGANGFLLESERRCALEPGRSIS